MREMQGGRSAVTFDYRVVATALGKAGQRMTLANGLAKIPPHVTFTHSARRAPPAPPAFPAGS